MGFGASGQVEQERQAAGAMREAVNWILRASSAKPIPPLHPLPSPCPDDTADCGLRPQQEPPNTQQEPQPQPQQEQQLWVGVDIGGTLCKVVRWEIGGAPAEASGSAQGLRAAPGTGAEPARLHVHSHAPIRTLCSLCQLGGQCLEEATSGTSAASKTSSSTSCSSSSSACSASLWASGLAPLDRSCSSGPAGDTCTCPLTSGMLRFTRFETWRVPEFLSVLAEEHARMAPKQSATDGPSLELQQPPKISIGITGGGARRFDKELRGLTWIDVKRADELSSLVRGIDLLARVAPQDCFEYPGVTALRGGVIQRPYRSPSDPPSSPCSSSSAASIQGEGDAEGEGEVEVEGDPAFLATEEESALEPATQLALPAPRRGPSPSSAAAEAEAAAKREVAMPGERLEQGLGSGGHQEDARGLDLDEAGDGEEAVGHAKREGPWSAARAPLGAAPERQADCGGVAAASATETGLRAPRIPEGEGTQTGEQAWGFPTHSEEGPAAEEEAEEEEEEDEDDGDEEVSEGLQYPYLVVNIGSGVSVLRVDGPGEFERVGGSSLGGSTFLGLTMALTGCATFREALALASKGDSSHVDMLVGDIYGGDYTQMGLKATTVASSFGKLVHTRSHNAAMGGPQGDGPLESTGSDPGLKAGGGSGGSTGGSPGVEQQHLAKAALLMITNNVGSLAMLHARPAGVRHILFSGSFLHGNKLAMRSLAAAVDFWSKGAMRALFLRHEGHAGALGAMLACMPLGP